MFREWIVYLALGCVAVLGRMHQRLELRGGSVVVDEELYSRQLLAFGREAQGRLSQARVLVFGCDGIGVEVCKNLALAGVSELVVNDGEAICEEKDIIENCFLRESDIGKARGAASVERLAELNAYCQVRAVTFADAKNFDCIFLSASVPQDVAIELVNQCAEANIGIVYASAHGSAVRLATDFGYGFRAIDRESYGAASEPKLVDSLKPLENGKEGFRFELANGERHDAQVGDTVSLKPMHQDISLKVTDVPSPSVLITEASTREISTIDQDSLRIITLPATSVYESPRLAQYFKDLILSREDADERLVPLYGIAGGVAAHEVLKCLARGALGPPACYGSKERSWKLEYSPINTDTITEQRVFVVGAGATGCELLKNLALLGVKNVIVADDDAIETSNLNRQFLFRKADLGRNKAQVAAERVLAFFKDKQKANFTAIAKRVDATSKAQFDEIIASSDCVFSCLDNVAARRFVDALCLEHCKPLIDTGTLGSRGSVQVVLPHLTETYSDAADPEDNDDPIALCTLKQHPYRADHVVLWAKDCFEEYFTRRPERLRRLFAAYGDAGSVRHYFRGRALSEAHEALEDVRALLSRGMSSTQWADSLYDYIFVQRTEALKSAHPRDSVDENGEPYWIGSRLWPRDIDPEMPAVKQFLEAAARLRRLSLFPDESEHEEDIIDPSTSIEHGDVISSLELDLARLHSKENIPRVDSLRFEKDDDEHLALVAAAANIRAAIFGIPPVDSLRCKQIAGRVVPAVATTTAVVSALATLEFLKLVSGAESTDFRNAFVNLALPSRWTLAEPFPCESWSLPDGRTVDPWTPRPVLRLDDRTPLPDFILNTLLPAVFPSGIPPGLRVASILSKPDGDLIYLDALHRNDFRPAREVLLAVDLDDEREDQVKAASAPLPDFLDVDVTVAFELADDEEEDSVSDLLEPDETPLPPVRLLLI